MTRVQDPEGDEFRALIERNSVALGRLVRHYEAVPEGRRELEQELLVGLWRARGSFRGESSERTWVYRIALNIAATHVARAIRVRRVASEEPTTSESSRALRPDVIAEGRSELRSLEQRIRALDLPARQLVLLALEGCTTAEIADVTGLSPTNVTTRLSRIRKQLALEIDSEEFRTA